jgi:hypothetical protein
MQCKNLLGNPLVVGLELIAREADGLDSTLSELGLELGHLAELGGADGSEVAVCEALLLACYTPRMDHPSPAQIRGLTRGAKKTPGSTP